MKALKKTFRLLHFLGFYIGNILQANVRLAMDVLRPQMRLRPGFIKVSLTVETDLEILMYANLETMTPGTVVLDVSPDREFLFIHSMYVSENDEERERTGQELQRHVLEVMR
ncbi:MAG: Na+/H+ antiporter subunit E [Bdellovibrionaceae bacterium]|nr:Na+/H+ antiporter subunit E [Pseudobdellovibrionaceae bacterium]